MANKKDNIDGAKEAEKVASEASAKPAPAKKAATTTKPATAKKPAATTKAATAKKPAATTKSTTEKKTTTKKAAPAKKKEEVAKVEPVVTEEVAPVETVAPVEPVNVAAAPAEAPLVAIEVLTEEKSEKPSFVQKIKAKLANLGDTVKGWFVKEKPIVITDASGEMHTLTGYSSNLSKKERFVRFLRSQSGWGFVLPAVVLLCIFTLYPIVNAFIRAFMQNYRPNNVKNPYEGWGFENFVRVLKGDTGMGGANFWQCLINTFIVTIISVPLSILVALLIAVALNSIKAVQKAYQTILFLPYLTNALAMGAVFATFFNVVGTPSNPESPGLVNNFLGLFGIDPIEWLKPESHYWGSGKVKIYWASYTAAIIYDVWAGLPFKILILFSSLQSVNKQYYDAAKVDGASKSKILWKITAPMISPMLSYLFITGVMGGMKSYSSIIGLFGETMGGDYAMGTMVGYIYQYIDKGQMGYAFAGSLLLFIIIMIITGINNYVSKKRVTYT